MDFSSVASVFFMLAKPLSWGVAFGSSCGCLVGISVARMQSVLAANPNASKDAPLATPRRLVAGRSVGTVNSETEVVNSGLDLVGRSVGTVNSDTEVAFSGLDSMKLELQEKELNDFVCLLRNLVGESWYLRNDPAAEVTPEERRAAALVRDELDCFAQPDLEACPLQVVPFEYEDGRTNLGVIYDVTKDPNAPSIAFATHFDVSPAEGKQKTSPQGEGCGIEGLKHLLGFDRWKESNSKLFRLDSREQPDGLGTELYGRGTSAGLSHVALLTLFLCELATSKPKLRHSIHVIFFAAREGGEIDIGADRLLKERDFSEFCKLKEDSPVFWLDAADSRLCHASTGSLGWKLKARANQASNGVHHKCDNSVELAYAALVHIQNKFDAKFSSLPQDTLPNASLLKPTCIESSGSSSQGCLETVMYGDVRIMPSHNIVETMKDIERDLDEFIEKQKAEVSKVLEVEWSWIGSLKRPPKRKREAEGNLEANVEPWSCPICGEADPDALDLASRSAACARKNHSDALDLADILEGIAVRRDTEAHHALAAALQQICGFGKLDKMRTDDEHCSLQDMSRGYQVLCRLVCLLEQGKANASFSTDSHDQLAASSSSGLPIGNVHRTPEETSGFASVVGHCPGKVDLMPQPTERETANIDDCAMPPEAGLEIMRQSSQNMLPASCLFMASSAQADELRDYVGVSPIGTTASPEAAMLTSADALRKTSNFSHLASVASWMQLRPWPLPKVASSNKDDMQEVGSLVDNVCKSEFAEIAIPHDSDAFWKVVPAVPSNQTSESQPTPQNRHVASRSQQESTLPWLPFSWIWTGSA